MKVEIELPLCKAGGTLQPGMFGRGTISGDLYIGTEHGALMLPECHHTPCRGPGGIDVLPPGTRITITV